MGFTRQILRWRRQNRRVRHWLALLVIAPILFAGCHSIPPVDTKPLDSVGMNYDAIKELNALKITTPEVAEIAQARQSGFSDASCVQVLQLYRTRNQPFDAGSTIAGLTGAGISEELVLNLARLNQLGINAGEIEAMRLAGISEPILFAVAQHHAAGQPVLSGASLAGMRNLGVRSDTLLQLVQHSVPDSQASEIIAMRRHGAKDADILRHYAGS